MSAADIASICENSKELDRLRKQLDETLIEINKLHKKLQTTAHEVIEKSGDNLLLRLKNLYIEAKQQSETEVRLTNLIAARLDALLLSGNPGQQRRRLEGNEHKKKQKKNDSDISRVSPSMRNQLDNCASLKGEQVAARISTDGSHKDDIIIVKVINFDRETRQFEVLDEVPGDDEVGGGQRTYKLPMSHIIPLPKKNDPSTAIDFLAGQAVLAVYPNTTALYKATVLNANRKRKTDDYLLEFDDDESEDGLMQKQVVPFHNVVTLPEGYRQ